MDDLYREYILEHYKRPHNWGELEHPDLEFSDLNPLCGDELTVQLSVAADGTVTNETYPQTKEFDGGFCVLELPSREAAVQWAAKIAKSCRCSQELREFQYDPES